VDTVLHPAQGEESERARLIMLPGAGMVPQDFAERGFVQAIHERKLPLGVVAAGPDLGLYLDNTVALHIHREIIAPLRRDAPARLWLLGISPGGMGALLYAGAYPEEVDGIVLLAPFLGTPGMIEEVAQAGGLAAWQPGAVATNDGERQLLAWLKRYAAVRPPRPKVYLGYGRDDRFSRGHAMLAAHLPEEQVHVGTGGHDWETWIELWREILKRRPFDEAG